MRRLFARSLGRDPAFAGVGQALPGEADTVLQRSSNREVFTEKPSLGDIAAICGIGSFIILLVALIHTAPPKD